jgi:predicted enzyme related to lactoylglutathione lyase
MVDDDVPSTWGAYFAVADLHAAIETTLHLGGAQHMGPMSAGEIGEFAILGGPGGEIFNVIEYAQPLD